VKEASAWTRFKFKTPTVAVVQRGPAKRKEFMTRQDSKPVKDLNRTKPETSNKGGLHRAEAKAAGPELAIPALARIHQHFIHRQQFYTGDA
jgi:hypothetical protein